MHHSDRNGPHPWLSRLAGPVLLLAICAGFYWKLVLTDQYTWLENPDLAYQVLPWLQFQAGEWHSGRVPLWDPHHWGGQSLIGQAQPGVAYPLNWILFLLPLRNGWIRQASLHWYFIAIHFMAALFSYWLCRDLKRSRMASVLAGLAFALGGYIGTTDWPQMINGAVWAPLVFLYLLRAIRGERPVSSAALSGLFLGISWLSGHHQIPIYICLAAGAVWLFYILRKGVPDWRVLRLAAVFVVFLILVSGLQTLPAYEYGKLAQRWVGTEQPLAWNEPVPYSIHRSFSLTPTSLLGILIPGIHHHANPFTGVVVFSLACLGIALGWKRHVVRLFAAVALGGLLFSMGATNVFHGIIYALIPFVDKARNPSMAVFIFHFGISVLSAYGIDSLLSRRHSVWLRRVCFALAVFGAALLTILMGLALTQTPLAEERVGVVAAVALLLAAIMYGWARGAMQRTVWASLALLLMLVELGNVSGYIFPNKADAGRKQYLRIMADHADIAVFLRSQTWPLRVSVPREVIPYNFGDWHGIDVFEGYVASLPANLLALDLQGSRVRDLFGVGYIVGNNPSAAGQTEVFRGASGLKVYRNPSAFPRTWTVHEARSVRDEHGARAIMQDHSFDLRRKTFLSGPVPAMEQCGGEDRVRMLRRTSGSLTVQADMKCRGLVVISENYFPGWRAAVDGKPVQIHEAYGVLRGVTVDAGRHTVEMKYRPGSVMLGALMTAAGLLGAAILAILDRRSRVWNHRES